MPQQSMARHERRHDGSLVYSQQLHRWPQALTCNPPPKGGGFYLPTHNSAFHMSASFVDLGVFGRNGDFRYQLEAASLRLARAWSGLEAAEGDPSLLADRHCRIVNDLRHYR